MRRVAGCHVALAVLVCVAGVALGWLTDPEVSGVADLVFVKGKGWTVSVRSAKASVSSPANMIEGLEIADVEHVLNGRPVANTAHPYVGSLHALNQDGTLVFFCSAHLVGADVAITAAHCLFPNFSYVICAGSVDATNPGICSQAVDISTHPDFDQFQLASPDVSVLTLAEELNGFGIDAMRVAYEVPDVNRKVFMAGFAVDEPGPMLLREAQSNVILKNEDCKFLQDLEPSFPGITELPQLMCVAGESRFEPGPFAACFDDSGSPLISQNIARIRSFGVFSFSSCTGGVGGESVYMAYSSPVIRDFLKPLLRTIRRKMNPKLGPCPARATGSDLVWFRSKATAMREIAFAQIEDPKEIPDHFYFGDEVNAMPYTVDSSGADLNRSTIFVAEQEIGDVFRQVFYINHGPPQDGDGNLLEGKTTISMSIRNIPEDSTVYLLPGTESFDAPFAGALDVTWKYGGSMHTGLQIVLPFRNLRRCMQFSFGETSRTSSLQFVTPDPTYKGGRPYPVFEGFFFDICPWRCQKNVRNRKFNPGPDPATLPVDFTVVDDSK